MGFWANVACNGTKPVGIFFLNFQVLDLPLWKEKSWQVDNMFAQILHTLLIILCCSSTQDTVLFIHRLSTLLAYTKQKKHILGLVGKGFWKWQSLVVLTAAKVDDITVLTGNVVIAETILKPIPRAWSAWLVCWHHSRHQMWSQQATMSLQLTSPWSISRRFRLRSWHNLIL